MVALVVTGDAHRPEGSRLTVPIDWSLFAFPKGTPAIVARKKKDVDEAKAWKATKGSVDKRDAGADGAPRCFITGKRLQNTNPLLTSTYRERAHLDARSTNKARRFDETNVVTVSKEVHTAIDKGLLFLLTKKFDEAKTVNSIFCVAWNRRWVPKDLELFKIRRGLPVVELEKVAK